MRVLFFFLFFFYIPFLFSAASYQAPFLKHSLTDPREPFDPQHHISIKMLHLQEMKRVGVRPPKFYPVTQPRAIRDDFMQQAEPVTCHPCVLSAVCIVKGLCTVYETHDNQRTFTLQLSNLTDKLEYESTEAYRNLDYFFDAMTGTKSKSWAEKAQEESEKKQMLVRYFDREGLKRVRHEEHDKIRWYRHFFKEGVKALPKYKRSPYIIPTQYVIKLMEIEKDFKRRPNPFFVEFLHTKIAQLEKAETVKKLWS